MTKTKRKPKHKQNSPPVAKVTENANNTAETSIVQQQFEEELYWCIQQLQTTLRLGKLNRKQVRDHTKGLNILMSETTPFVEKRQVMRYLFGDYRSIMAAEEKKLKKLNMQVKLSPAKPSPKSLFVKKSTTFASSDNNFKFNFEVPKKTENMVQDDIKVKIEENAEGCENMIQDVKVKMEEEAEGCEDMVQDYVKVKMEENVEGCENIVQDVKVKMEEKAERCENMVQIDVKVKMEEEAEKCDNFTFLPSDNSFKFNFNVTD